MTPQIKIMAFRGKESKNLVDAMGQLRIQVFREYPYLYDGTLDYERDYLQRYFEHPDSVCVACFDQNRGATKSQQLVGVSTGMPLEAEMQEFQEPFLGLEIDVSKIFYFGESVLNSDYRGLGIGKAFFHHREAHARSLNGIQETTFCAVVRENHHPQKPLSYRSLEDFWRKMGYEPDPRIQASFKWKEISHPSETPKTMQFWRKLLSA